MCFVLSEQTAQVSCYTKAARGWFWIDLSEKETIF
jgi:hypothetical protein